MCAVMYASYTNRSASRERVVEHNRRRNCREFSTCFHQKFAHTPSSTSLVCAFSTNTPVYIRGCIRGGNVSRAQHSMRGTKTSLRVVLVVRSYTLVVVVVVDGY